MAPPPSGYTSQPPHNGTNPRACSRRRWVPTPLTPLDAPAFIPEVDNSRLGYIEGSNRGKCSNMTMIELQEVAKSFPWPKGVRLRLPCDNGGFLARYPGCIVVHEEALKVGFRLPLHPFICDFLSETDLCPAELTPKVWRTVLAFLLRFKDLNRVPSYEAILSMFLTIPSGCSFTICSPHAFLYVDIVKGVSWDTKWFLVCESEEFRFDFPRYPGNRWVVEGGSKRRWDTIRNEVQELIEIFKKQHLGRTLVTESRLEEAGMSLHHPMKVSTTPADSRKTCLSCLKRKASSDPEEEEEEKDENDVHLGGGHEGASSIATLCRPEVTAALRHLPEIISAARHSKELELQLDETKRENAQLKKDNATLQSRIECLEKEKDNLAEVTQKAREFVEMSSSLLKVKK